MLWQWTMEERWLTTVALLEYLSMIVDWASLKEAFSDFGFLLETPLNCDGMTDFVRTMLAYGM
jgi:hypothetical protein